MASDVHQPDPSTSSEGRYEYDVCVVGGCGHVGLPLALTFADHGLKVAIYDINEASVGTVRGGRMPFRENGADELLGRVQAGQNPLHLSSTPEGVPQSR